MSQLSPEQLKAPIWHVSAKGHKAKAAIPDGIWEFIIPGTVVLLLLSLGAHVMAAIVAGISTVLIAVRHLSPVGRRRIDKALTAFAHWVASIAAVILLAPVFFIAMTLVRLMKRLTGSDPLHLRSGENMTYWLPSDLERRRSKHVSRMFCTERLSKGGMGLVPLLVLGVGLIAATEIGLRIYGFRHAVLYVQDYDIGYYPKPNQRVRHPGRVIEINQHGMRAPRIADQKPPGKFRILMLGDSTLAGTRVSNHQLYSSLLQDKLNAAAGRDVFEVMNMGVNAWGPHHEFAFVRKFGSFDADLAIICGPVLNCYRPRYTMESLPFLPENHPPRLALEHVAYQLLWQYRTKCLGPAPWSQGKAAEQEAEKGIEAYGQMAEFLQASGAEVIAEMLPGSEVTLGRLQEDPHCTELIGRINGRLARSGAKANMAGNIFKGVPDPAAIYHDRVHFDLPGHQLYADYLYGQVRKNSVKIANILGNP